jgi:hypothetical protein
VAGGGTPIENILAITYPACYALNGSARTAPACPEDI